MRTFLVIAVAAALAAGGVVARVDAPPVPAMSTVPFALLTSGRQARPVVTARFNGHPFGMMIHSNASFDVQLRHVQARAFGIRGLRDLGRRYGIEHLGKVSDLELGTGTMDRVQVGATVDRGVRISVFEVPQDDLGMLAIGWIRRNRVILDYATNRATMAPTAAHVASMRARLAAAGYTAVPMTFDAKDMRYTVRATIGGVTRSMTVASASSTTFDPVFAAAAGIAQGPRFETGSGPTGTAVPIYALGAPVTVALGRWKATPVTDAEIMDQYAYSAQPRPADATASSDSQLGSLFLVAAHAIVDFGNGVLYVK